MKKKFTNCVRATMEKRTARAGAIKVDCKIANKSSAKPQVAAPRGASPVRGDIYVASAFKAGLKSLKNSASLSEAARQRESDLRPSLRFMVTFTSNHGYSRPFTPIHGTPGGEGVAIRWPHREVQSVFVSLHQPTSTYVRLHQPILTPLFFSAGGIRMVAARENQLRLSRSKVFQPVSRRFKPFSEKKDCLFFAAGLDHARDTVTGRAWDRLDAFAPLWQIRPKIKGIKPKSNRHAPKTFMFGALHYASFCF